MPCPISPPAHPIRTSPRLHSLPLHAAADVAVAVGGALAVTFATTGIAGSFGDGPDVDAAVAALLGGISGGELGIGRCGG